MHFCTLVARGNGAGTRPVRYGTNGTMPATVNSSVGSSLTSDAEGTMVWPRSPKKLSQRFWMSAVCMVSVIGGRGAREATRTRADDGWR